MEKQIRVRTPLTENGTMPLIGSDGRQVFTENILNASARKGLEKLNEKLPQALKSIIEDIDEQVKEPVAVASSENTVKKIKNDKAA